MKTMRMMGVLLALAVLAGCTTTPMDLVAENSNHEVWAVQSPIEQTFRSLKSYIIQNYEDDMLFGARIEQQSYYYGDDAEIAVRFVGNPLGSDTFIYMLLKSKNETTQVESWCRSGGWCDRLHEMRRSLK